MVGILSRIVPLCLLVMAGNACIAPVAPAFVADHERSGARFYRLGPYGGSVRSLLIDSRRPANVYLGTSKGQIFKSADGGKTWGPLFPGIGRLHFVIDTLVQHPRQPDRLYAGAWDLQSNGGGLFESRDGGISWAEVTLPETSPAVRDLAISKNNPAYMIVGALGGVYVSSDSGKTWRSVGRAAPGLEKVESVAIDPEDPRFLFAGTWRLGYRSGDFGKTWFRMEQGIPLDSHLFSFSVDDDDPEILYASACSGIFRSANRGTSWKRLKVLPDRFSVRAHAVYRDPSDASRVYGGTTEGLFVSNDRGQTWSRITSPRVVVNALKVDPYDARRILLGTEHQGVLISDDGGRSWRESNTGFVHRQISRIMTDPRYPGHLLTGVWSYGAGDGLYLFEKSENRWTSLAPKFSRTVEVLSFLSLPGKSGRIAGTTRGIYRQAYDALEWSKVAGPIEERRVNDLVFDARSSWIFAGTDRGVYRARSAEMKFQLPSSGFFLEVASVAPSPNGSEFLYAGTNLGVYRSPDHGLSWQVLSAGMAGGAAVKCVAICPAEVDHVLAGTSLGLYESRNGGASWHRTGDGRLGVEVSAVMFLDPSGQRIVAADGVFGGVFASFDGGTTWDKIETPGFSFPVRSLAQDPEQPSWIYLGTSADGVYRLQLPTNDLSE